MDPHQTNIFTAVVIASLLIGTIIIYFSLSLVRHHRRRLELIRLNMLAEITMLEKEHTRMAADLHDELGPLLTAVKFNIMSLKIIKDEEYILERATSQIDEAVSRVREIAKNLLPATLERGGIKETLEEFICSLRPPPEIEFIYSVRRSVPNDKKMHIYRLVTEIIQNALKHSGAKRLLIRIEERENSLCILCEDNGFGFDYEVALQQSKGIGLRNLKNRAELLRGKLEVYTVLRRGSQFRLTIPF